MEDIVKRKIFCLVIAMSMLFTLAVHDIASADTTSGWTKKTVNGISYKYDSEVWNISSSSGNSVQAIAQVMTVEMKNAKAGYMGAQARLYTAAGTLKKSGDMVYNEIPCTNLYAYSPKATSKNTYFYSQSKIKLYNGNGYTTYTALASPNCKVKTASLDFEDDEKEELSTTVFINSEEELSYGSGLQVDENGEEPDLIQAIGINNKSGYVKSDDLTPDVTTPKEACEVSEELGDVYTIPLYDLNGNVIDQFVVGE